MSNNNHRIPQENWSIANVNPDADVWWFGVVNIPSSNNKNLMLWDLVYVELPWTKEIDHRKPYYYLQGLIGWHIVTNENPYTFDEPNHIWAMFVKNILKIYN